MPGIQITNLTFAYDGGAPIFNNISLSLDSSWKTGFIGRNGRGKTTFLKLLAEKLPYRGQIAASGQFLYFPFPQPPAFISAQEALTTFVPGTPFWRLQRELSLLETGEALLSRPFSSLSGGEQARLMLAALFTAENTFPLIDEPTNHLDEAGRRLVSGYLRQKPGFLLVSHDRAFLDGCIDHVISLNRADIEVQRGNFSSWQINRERQDAFELSQNKRLLSEIEELTLAAGRAAGWADKVEKSKNTRVSGLRPDKGYIGHKSAKMMKRAKNMQTRAKKAAEEKSLLLKNVETAEKISLSPLAHHSTRLIEFSGASFSYGAHPACRGISFTLSQGERIALTGPNGCGKSTILKWIAEEEGLSCRGGFYRAANLVVSYIPQSIAGVSGSLRDFLRAEKVDEPLFKAVLRKLDFERHHFDGDISSLSAGQKKKLYLARSLCRRAHVYVWDEPLNYIDVLSRMQIEEVILACAPTLLFVEHDRAFRERAATKSIVLSVG